MGRFEARLCPYQIEVCVCVCVGGGGNDVLGPYIVATLVVGGGVKMGVSEYCHHLIVSA